ncbi:acyltransferase [Streptomyces sp. NPDC005263]|uniref:acyltransferase n=1 Tax=Streptomyces sp. NPDC005263 TaxID=3364711 RepID=UPI0036C5C717
MDLRRPEPSVRHFDHCPWLFAGEASEDQRSAQRERQQSIGGDSEIGERCYVAESAAVFPDRLRLGDGSYIAAHAYVTGELTAGADCTLNPFTTVRGDVVLGSGVRIGAHTSLLGFNHSMAPDRPVFQQPLTSRGIRIGDDVWIGSHVVVVDGVTIGDHCVIGAGAVVTRDLPAWTVAAGNPARHIRDRRDAGAGDDRRDDGSRGAVGAESSGAGGHASGTGSDHSSHHTTVEAPRRSPGRPAGTELSRFADTVRAQAPELLARCWDGDRYVDRPGAAPTVRAHCDAVEIADLLLGAAPEQLTPDEHTGRLAALQDPRTGLVPEFGESLEEDGFPRAGAALYHVLCVGYALDLLGSRLPHPVRGAGEMTAGHLVARLDELPWRDEAWSAGAWVDAWATAAHWNLRRSEDGGMEPGAVESLFGWLLSRADPWTGMWGAPSPEAGRLQVVNGYYRLTRGSFAQFGLPVPHPERVVDAVVDHARDGRYFGAGQENACNVLDVAHPLWLCTRRLGANGGHGYRAAEIRAWAERQLAAALPRWRDGRGFGFGPGASGPGPEPGLQGTEMWLAIIWLLADLLGRSDELGYRPRGIHRPEPARATQGYAEA